MGSNDSNIPSNPPPAYTGVYEPVAFKGQPGPKKLAIRGNAASTGPKKLTTEQYYNELARLRGLKTGQKEKTVPMSTGKDLQFKPLAGDTSPDKWKAAGLISESHWNVKQGKQWVGVSVLRAQHPIGDAYLQRNAAKLGLVKVQFGNAPSYMLKADAKRLGLSPIANQPLKARVA